VHFTLKKTQETGRHVGDGKGSIFATFFVFVFCLPLVLFIYYFFPEMDFPSIVRSQEIQTTKTQEQ
jgi:hypothetical protein